MYTHRNLDIKYVEGSQDTLKTIFANFYNVFININIKIIINRYSVLIKLIIKLYTISIVW